MQYSNKQTATALLLVMGSAICIVLLTVGNKNSEFMWPVIIILGVVTFLFHSLNIQVNSEAITWSFGPGFWKKSINIDSIKSVKVIKTKWYYGLGIRFIPTGWLYTVSGTTAIELELKNGNKVSLGTNDSENLIKAIQSQLIN